MQYRIEHTTEGTYYAQVKEDTSNSWLYLYRHHTGIVSHYFNATPCVSKEGAIKFIEAYKRQNPTYTYI